MNIECIHISIELFSEYPSRYPEFIMSVRTGGRNYETHIPFHGDHFESEFDHLVEQAKKEILKLLKK